MKRSKKKTKTWSGWMVFDSDGVLAHRYVYRRKRDALIGPYDQAITEAGFTVRRVTITLSAGGGK